MRRAGSFSRPPPGLINSVQLTLVNLDVDVVSPAAVSVQREARAGRRRRAWCSRRLPGAWLGWRPRSRDVKGEKPVFYAEVTSFTCLRPG